MTAAKQVKHFEKIVTNNGGNMLEIEKDMGESLLERWVALWRVRNCSYV